jgi:hypothetical protein
MAPYLCLDRALLLSGLHNFTVPTARGRSYAYLGVTGRGYFLSKRNSGGCEGGNRKLRFFALGSSGGSGVLTEIWTHVNLPSDCCFVANLKVCDQTCGTNRIAYFTSNETSALLIGISEEGSISDGRPAPYKTDLPLAVTKTLTNFGHGKSRWSPGIRFGKAKALLGGERSTV